MSFMERLDRDTVRTSASPPEIDHPASARANLTAAGDDLKQAFTPDLTLEAVHLMQGGDAVSFAAAGLSMALGVLSLPWAIAGDVLELPVKPVFAVKDLADAAVHGVIAGFRKLTN